ncbi:MAG: threonylcarbamoyl-AMP synthase [Desulfococcus sp. 4484_241]|nr:MAG: threonylcarbamoyl-AMP synthase [Desulfococcus sp. 4484_241]
MSRERPASLEWGSKTFKIDPAFPDPALIARACDIIGSGGVVAFPTMSLYGLGADAWNRHAVEKVRLIKRRPESKPVLLLVKDVSFVDRLARKVGDTARSLIEHFWPGDITLVFEADPGVPGHLLSGSGKIGLRVPAHPVARAIVEAFGGPVTGTSANLSGSKSCYTMEMVRESLGVLPDLMLDAGPLRGGVGSTVVDVSVSPPLILREGAVCAKDVMAVVT